MTERNESALIPIPEITPEQSRLLRAAEATAKPIRQLELSALQSAGQSWEEIEKIRGSKLTTFIEAGPRPPSIVLGLRK